MLKWNGQLKAMRGRAMLMIVCWQWSAIMLNQDAEGLDVLGAGGLQPTCYKLKIIGGWPRGAVVSLLKL